MNDGFPQFFTTFYRKQPQPAAGSSTKFFSVNPLCPCFNDSKIQVKYHISLALSPEIQELNYMSIHSLNIQRKEINILLTTTCMVVIN